VPTVEGIVVSSYLGALRHRNFRYLFLGQTASVVGDRAVVVALALYVTQTTGSATDLGLILGFQTLPLVALLVFGGVWADRLPRHRIMITADVARATLHALLAVLILTGEVQVWQIVVIEALFGAAQAFFMPAYSGLVPQTVPEELILEAQALTQWTENLAFLLGPALATILVLTVGAGETLALDAATFVVSALLLTQVRPRARGPAVASASFAREVRDGWHEVASRTWVWATIAAFAGAVLCVYAQWYALAPSIARDVYGHTSVFGVVEAVVGVGALGGAAISIRWRPVHPLRVGLLLILAWPIQCLAFALGAPLALVIVVSFVAGAGFSLFLIWWGTALARHIPAHALSRVSAYDWMGSLALLPLGYLIAGPLAGAFGAQTVLGVGSAIGAVLIGLALVPQATRDLTDGPAVISARPTGLMPQRPATRLETDGQHG
jgi:MFS family permease